MKQPQRIEFDIPKKAFLPCYHHLLKSDNDIEFLWGGRDSGKSAHIARQLIIDCLRLPYFRCVLARKVFNTIKESQWQLIKDTLEDWKIDHFFTFKTAPLEIICNLNGNRFICRGMDEPGKLKSISNPSHCWAEEMNQMDLDDFIVILTSLRYNRGKVKVWCSFNPEADGDYEDFWLYTTFFKDKPLSFSDEWVLEVPGDPPQTLRFRYRSTHTTYSDNKFCRPERRAILEMLKGIDPFYYMVFTKGLWGNRKVDDPYCFAFSKEKHERTTTHQPRLVTVASFDFNVNPITCGIYQHEGKKVWGVESVKLANSDIYKLCDYVVAKYPKATWLVTGDATGRNTTALVQDGINYYTVIKAKMKLAQAQLKVPTINPKVEENRVLVNAVFQILDVSFDPVNCKDLIFDCQNVTADTMGKIDKGDRKNPKKRADHLDHFRYYLNTFHKHILKL